eukprot:11831-Pelagococcus_subviridis.AAC.1
MIQYSETRSRRALLVSDARATALAAESTARVEAGRACPPSRTSRRRFLSHARARGGITRAPRSFRRRRSDARARARGARFLRRGIIL